MFWLKPARDLIRPQAAFPFVSAQFFLFTDSQMTLLTSAVMLEAHPYILYLRSDFLLMSVNFFRKWQFLRLYKCGESALPSLPAQLCVG